MPNRTFTSSHVASFEESQQPTNAPRTASPPLSETPSDVTTEILPPSNPVSPSAEILPEPLTLFAGTFSNTPPLTHHPMDLSDASTNLSPSPSDLSEPAQTVSPSSDSAGFSNMMAIAPLPLLEVDIVTDMQHTSATSSGEQPQHFEVVYNAPAASLSETHSNNAPSSSILNCEFFVPTTHTIARSFMQGCYRYATPVDPFPPGPFPHTLTAPSSSLFTGTEWGPHAANAALLNHPHTVPTYPSGFFASEDEDMGHESSLPIPLIVIDAASVPDDGNNPNSLSSDNTFTEHPTIPETHPSLEDEAINDVIVGPAGLAADAGHSCACCGCFSTLCSFFNWLGSKFF